MLELYYSFGAPQICSLPFCIIFSDVFRGLWYTNLEITIKIVGCL